jgi:hypothetical protein
MVRFRLASQRGLQGGKPGIESGEIQELVLGNLLCQYNRNGRGEIIEIERHVA